jgi:hypothetical protein
MTLPPVKRLTDLVSVVDQVCNELTASSNQPTLSISACLKTLDGCVSNLSTYLDANSTVPAVRNQRSDLKAVLNTVSGLRQGLSDRSCSSTFYRTTIRNTLPRLDRVKAWASTKLEEHTTLSPEDHALKVCFTGDLKEGLKLLQEAKEQALASEQELDDKGYAESERKDLAKYKAQLAKYTKYINKVPTKVKNFTVFQAPLLPIFEDFTLMSSKTLTHINVKHSKVGPYFVVYEDQYILAVSKKSALAGDKLKETTKKVPKSGKAQSTRLKQIQVYVDKIVDLINERSVTTFAKVSEKPEHSSIKSDTVYFWIAPESQIKAMRKAATVKGLKIKGWNFPWNYEDVN